MMFKHAAAAGPLLLLLGCLPGARSHGQMMNPANWFMTDGLPRMCPMMDGASWGIGAMWYTNYTHVPAGVPVMPDDDPRRTFTDYSATPGCKCTAPDICVKIGSGDICVPGPGVYSARNPWRAPGASSVNGPCGGYGGNMHGCRHPDGTPAPCVIGGPAHGPDARDYCKCLLLLLVSPARHPTRPHIPSSVDMQMPRVSWARTSSGLVGRAALSWRQLTSCTPTTPEDTRTDCASSPRTVQSLKNVSKQATLISSAIRT
jgi:hypothetical protein